MEEERGGKRAWESLGTFGEESPLNRFTQKLAVGIGTFKSDLVRKYRTKSGRRIESGAIRQQNESFHGHLGLRPEMAGLRPTSGFGPERTACGRTKSDSNPKVVTVIPGGIRNEL